MEKLQEILAKIPKLYRILIVVAFCVLLLVAFYFLFISDMWAEMDKMEAAISELDLQIESQKKILAEGPKLEKEIGELEKRLQTMVASLPERPDIDVLIKKITDLLSESNLIHEKFTPGQEVKDEELYYAKIPFNIEVRGDFRKLGTFFTSLNSLPRIVNVPSVKLGKAGGLSPKENELVRRLGIVPLKATITGETYRRLSQEEIKAIAAKKSGPGGKPGPPPKK
jgi:type IV pilus assembly protein PilO